MNEEIYTTYAPETDMTFIMKDTFNTTGDILETQVVGWYYGEPNEEDTRGFYGWLAARY